MKLTITFNEISVEDALTMLKLVETTPDVEDEEKSDAEVDSGDTADKKPARRRRKKPAAETDPKPDAPAGQPAGDVDGVGDQGGTGRRRRRANADDAVGGESDPPRWRRNRASAATGSDTGSGGEDDAGGGSAEKGDSDVNPTTASAPAGGRRKKNAKKTASSPSEPEKSEITDADVAKAASAAAEKLTPKGVTEILDQFSVDNVGALNQEQRREFIDQLDAKVEG